MNPEPTATVRTTVVPSPMSRGGRHIPSDGSCGSGVEVAPRRRPWERCPCPQGTVEARQVRAAVDVGAGCSVKSLSYRMSCTVPMQGVVS